MDKVAKIYRARGFVLALIFLGVFLSVKQATAVGVGEVIINEVAWMGSASSTADEWIELYNRTTSMVDLAGWQIKTQGGEISIDSSKTIESGGYFLLERTVSSNSLGVAADQKYPYSFNLDNNGEELQLLDNNHSLIDAVVLILVGDKTKWPAGDSSQKLTMERTDSLGWQNSLVIGGTPKAKNSFIDNSQGQINYSNDIIINELLPNPSGSDDNEWVELYNNGTTTVDLTGWQIADNSKAFIINATSTFAATIEAQGFLIIPKSVSGISLNNTGGDSLKLMWPDGSVVGQTSYSDEAKDDYSWARNENNGFEWTTTLTEGGKNIITKPVVENSTSGGGGGTSSSLSSQAESSNSASSVFKDKIFISEILSNPFGLDGEANEWLEIYNTSTGMVILAGWKIKDNGGTYILKEKKIEAKSFLMFRRGETGLILNNEGGDFVELWDNNGKLVSKATYKTKAPEGESYNLCGKKWFWLKETTEGAENKCPLENDLPVAYFELENNKAVVGQVIVANGEESYDGDGKIVKYVWQFSDEVVAGQETNKIFETMSPLIGFRFLKAGIHQITLKVTDNLGGEDSYTEEIEASPDSQSPVSYENIFINEIMPNLTGKDEGQEWLELYNGGEVEADLGGFSLAIEKGKTYKIPAGTKLPKGGYLVFAATTTKLVLYNDGGVVKLIEPTGQSLREINYGKSREGQSYARDEEKGNSWSWTTKPTAGAVNVILGIVPVTKTATAGVSQAAGSFVRISGRVTAEPGLLGKTIFYLQEDSGRGAQIYSYYKDFPNLALGDLVEVVGTVSDYQGERRIKTKTKNDIKVIGAGEAVLPRELQIEDVGEDNEGVVVKITGQLTEVKGSYLWVDDGTEEIKIYIKQNTNINEDGLAVGDNLEVMGIVSQYGEEYRILPRFPEDIKVVGQVLGAETNKAQKDGTADGGSVLKYLLAVAVAVILVLVTMMVKRNKEIKK